MKNNLWSDCLTSIAAIIGFLIGYYLRRYRHLKYCETEEEISQLQSKIDVLSLEKQSLLSAPGDIQDIFIRNLADSHTCISHAEFVTETASADSYKLAMDNCDKSRVTMVVFST
jgi:hypothetical protein